MQLSYQDGTIFHGMREMTPANALNSDRRNAMKHIHTKGVSILTAFLVSFFLPSGTLLADSSDRLAGCYKVRHGAFSVARGTDPTDIVGRYRMLLVPTKQRSYEDDRKGKNDRFERGRKAVFFRGPMKGTPTMRTSTGALTRHVLGTNRRIGTLTSGDLEPDVFIANSGTCVGPDGLPLLIDATEIMHFSSGTGIFVGLTSGQIEWHGISNSCDDPDNRVADYDLVTGELCFE